MEGVRTKPPPYALPRSAAEYTGIIEDVAFENGPGPNGTFGGDGTMVYPGMTIGVVVEVADKVTETELGKMRLLPGRGAVPGIPISGLLDDWITGAVVKGLFGKVKEYTITGAPLEPDVSALDEIKELGGGGPADGCVKE